ncbi:YkgJ family cysteine cluster protein [[Ruminococcus] lactaris]|jgi:Fe-S-cluster containining protein|uniref:YkgJ family cysteine cluster protein n=1 Tax=[Ruminococcus] lactaris TaxID=46228 RepID=A0A415D557_9FIRM|nr:YkgJ family cysteine cluster protein [[Ruminococcus] lactaris]RHJ61151.1 YkgJ family cysteine cluster protein [[Ruminococcus] lactaris]DAX06865.1 MAG TPA: Putative zinc- or iron-chelating domain [Bacteriophage sp.]
MTAQTKWLSDAIEGMKNGTYDMTVDGKCSQCGACCSRCLPLSSKEIITIKQYIKAHDIKPYRHLFPVAKEVYDLACPFMDDSKLKEKCRIYPVRPEICRQFICKGDKKPFRMKAARYEVVDVRKEFFGE